MVWWGNSGGAAYAGRGPKAGFYFRDTDCLPVSGRGGLNYDVQLKRVGTSRGLGEGKDELLPPFHLEVVSHDEYTSEAD